MSVKPAQFRDDCIHCDTRDPSKIATEIAKKVPVEIEALYVGDYGFRARDNDTFLLERKESNDFLGSLGSGRLHSQCKRMLESGADHLFLLPEGVWMPSRDGKTFRTSRGKTAWNFMAIYHSLIEITALGIHVLPITPATQTARAIVQLRESVNNGTKYVVEKSHRAPLKLRDAETLPVRLIGPHIGKEKLLTLAGKYPNLWILFQSIMEGDESIPRLSGIGPTTVKKIREMLTAPITRRPK